MKKKLLLSIATVVLLLFSNTSFSQTINLGILESFEGYTGAGAVTNAGGATWTGDAGTNVGEFSGFGAPPFFTGNTYNANAATARCRFDLFRTYIHLNDLYVNYPATHAPAFGAGETLTPGVYSIPGAGSIGTILNLDGQGNPDAFFVIKYFGALTVGAGATVNLINGTKSSNVFYIADGAISVAANANIKGTLFSKIGAVGLGANAVLEGRMLSMQGAIVNGANAKASPPPDACTIPIFCEDNCSVAPAVDVLGIISNYALYTNLGAVPNTGTSGIDGNIGSDAGGVTGFEDSILIGAIHVADASTVQAHIDIDNAYNSLMALTNTIPTPAGVIPIVPAHAAVFGSVAAGGETINAGVYFINGAGSLLGTLVLDGQNNSNSIFVFKFAGAFSVGAQAKMILINGARRCNVFFIGGAGVPTGAISIGAGAILKGTFLSHGGACGSGASVFLAGRQLSTGGAVVTYSGIIYNNPVCVTSRTLKTTAITDSPSVVVGANTPSVILNDISKGVQAVIGTAPGQVILSFTNTATLTMNPDGTITVAANALPGTYPITYTICEVSNPTICSTVTSNVTVTVTAPAIVAVADTPSVLPGTNTPSVILNDTVNGIPAVIGTAPGQVTLTSTPNGPLTMNADGTIAVATNTLAGTYTITYTICEVNNPSHCSTVTTNVTVTAPAIVAVADTPSVLPGTNTPSVILNDTVNGVPAVIGTAPGQVTLTSTPNGPLTMNSDGTIAVVANTPAGTYTITYTICEVNNPTHCSAPTTVTVTVTAPTIVAVADTPSVLAGTNTPSVILNDTVNGVQAVIGTAPGQVTLTSTPNGPLTMNADGTITVAANALPGTYPITYTICEVSNPAICSTATSNVTVTNAQTVAGTITANQSICKDSTPNDLTIIGNSGNVIKWQKSTDLVFTSPIDIPLSASTTLLGATIGSLSETTYFRAVVQNGSSTIEYSNVVTITVPSTTWNGSSWSNGVPTITTTAYITGNYSESTNLIACTLTVSSNAVVAIPLGTNVTLNGKLTVETGSNFILNSNSNLIQQTAAINIGDITVNRISSPLYRLDYTLWSSPVSGSQTLFNFSPLTSNVGPSNIRFYTYNTLTNQYNSVNPVTTVFEQAKSYLIRTPNNWASWNASLTPAPQPWTGSFTGVPRNGTISFTMINTGSSTAINATGNPYPSAIVLDSFINGNSNAIEGTLWFWRKFNEDNNLVSYSTCTTIGCTLNNNATYADSNLISVGQGFMVKAKSGQTNLTFTNAMRSASNINQFYKFSSTPMDRYWLKMTNSANKSTGQNLIAYTPNATNDYDNGLDGLYSNDSSIAFYSKATTQEVVINARPSFEPTDIVPLTLKTNVADTYTFSLNQKEGVFNGAQDVLLRDNYNNTVQNLTLGDYSFSTAVGTFTDRFDIIYQNLLGNTNPTLDVNQIIIYNKDQTTFINSGEITMDSIKIFDLQGRLLFNKTGINDTKISLNLNFKNQVVLFQITSQAGNVIIRKVIN